MRIALIEAFSDISREEISNFDNAKTSLVGAASKVKGAEKVTDPQEEIATNLVDQYGNNNVQPIKNILVRSILSNGPDVKKNKFLSLVDELDFSISSQDDKKFDFLETSIDKNEINPEAQYLRRKSTYDTGDMKEFQFRVRILDTVNDSSKLSKFFVNTDEISEAQLYKGGNVNSSLLPLGDKDDTGNETLTGVVNSWSGPDGGNDASTDTDKGIDNSGKPTTNSGDYLVAYALKHQGINESSYYEFFIETIPSVFRNAKCKYKPRVNDASYYTKLITLIFNNPIKKLKHSELEKIRANHFVDLSKIPNDLKKDGKVVFVEFKEFTGKAPVDLKDSNFINNYMVYVNGEWKPYDPDEVEDFSKYKKVLLGSKTVEDISSHYSIIDGVLKSLDSSAFREVQDAVKR